MATLSDETKGKYLQILKLVVQKRAECFTQKEMGKYTKTSVRKVSDFEKGKVIDFALLDQYCGLADMRLSLEIN